MHRFVAAACAAGLSLTLAACSGGGTSQPAAPPPASAPAAQTPSAPASATADPASSAPASAAPASPAPAGSAPAGAPAPGTTDPAKLDGALLKDGQLAGWHSSEASGDAPDTGVDPAACKALHAATLGKVASDMGATHAWEKDDLYLQEFLDIVDRGTDSVDAAEKLVAQCPTFTMIDADEKTPVQVATFPATGIGERSLGIKLTMKGEANVDVYVVLAAQRDVVVTTMLQGEKPDPAMLVGITQQAVAEVAKNI